MRRRRAHRGTWSLLALVALAGCRVGAIEPEPLLGPAPVTIAVWPGLGGGFAALEPALLAGLDDAVRGRGYRIVNVAVTRELLRAADLWQSGDAAPAELGDVGRAVGADAVLEFEVRGYDDELDAVGRLLRARWDVGWRLLSTRMAGVLWQHAHRGHWRRQPGEPFDPLRRLDEPLQPVTIGGEGVPVFRDRQELAAHLHRLAMQSLPTR